MAPFLALQVQAELVKNARARYGQLAAERDSAVLAAQGVSALREENARLREILALSGRISGPHVAAELLHQATATDGFTLVLGAGREEGVTPMSPVIAARGLLGIVRSVERHTAVVTVWTNRDFRASAMTLDGSVYGIVAPRGSEGPNTMLLELRGVPYRDAVSTGTMIYTSGLGGKDAVFPRGIPIGRVVAVADEREGWSRTYLIRPEVHPASVSHVIVLTQRAPDQGGAFRMAP